MTRIPACDAEARAAVDADVYALLMAARATRGPTKRCLLIFKAWKLITAQVL